MTKPSEIINLIIQQTEEKEIWTNRELCVIVHAIIAFLDHDAKLNDEKIKARRKATN